MPKPAARSAIQGVSDSANGEKVATVESAPTLPCPGLTVHRVNARADPRGRHRDRAASIADCATPTMRNHTARTCCTRRCARCSART